jgi:hypothetical protein
MLVHGAMAASAQADQVGQLVLPAQFGGLDVVHVLGPSPAPAASTVAV